MNTEEYYQSLEFVSLSYLLKNITEDNVFQILNTFKCSKNKDLEDFITDPSKAISFEKREITRTYLYLDITDEKISLMGYYTITLNVLFTDGISKTKIKKLDGIDKDREYIPCYLIAQLGKNSICNYKIGQYILDDAIDTIKDSNQIVGGRFIILDSVNVKKVIDFYTTEPNAFVLLDNKFSQKENLKMYYPSI